MESGSLQVRMERFRGAGQRGAGCSGAGLCAAHARNAEEQTGFCWRCLMVFLTLSLISIFGAAARESQLEPGAEVPPARRSRARIAMAVAAVAVVGILFLGNMWWTSIANANASEKVYKAPPVEVSLANGNELVLKMGASPWHEQRKQMQLDKIIPDHGHLMHLFLVRMPEMDDFYHLHPDESAAGTFTEKMPAVAGGSYAVFADIVRESGFPDTMTAKIDLPRERQGHVRWWATIRTPLRRRFRPSRQTVTTAPLGADDHVEWVLDATHAAGPEAGAVAISRYRQKRRAGKGPRTVHGHGRPSGDLAARP